MATEQQRRDVRQELTDELVRLIEQGMAPWQKPWNPTAAAVALQLPQNPVTGKAYRGGNSIQLMVVASNMGQGEDPRWCTYKQAQSQGWQVKKGAKSQTIQYWKWEREEQRTHPITGQSETVAIKLDTPVPFVAAVFHASQIEGIPPYAAPSHAREQWETVALADAIVQQSGARIVHDQVDRAFYSPSADEIHLPPRAAFANELDYYEVLLHEVGHWSGHQNRLNRDLSGEFGSPSYAREELRAQLASLFLSAELGIPYQPQRHAAYQASWIEALKKDKSEIYQAASQAHQIAEYVMAMSPSLVPAAEQQVSGRQQPTPDPLVQPDGQTLGQQLVFESQAFPRTSFEQVAQALGFISPATGRDEWVKIGMAIKSEFPSEDGFALFDGWSQGGENYKASSAAATWQSINTGGGITIATLFKQALANGWQPADTLQAEMNRPAGPARSQQVEAAATQAAQQEAQNKAQNKAQKASLKLAKQEQTAAQAVEMWLAGTPDTLSPYLKRKGVASHGLRTLSNGVLLVPLVDEDGKLWNLQRILPQMPDNADTDKFYLKDGRKSGLFHVIGEIQAQRPVLFAEGYATAASLYEATGHPVVVTFDSGNLVNVAKLFRGFYPDQPMLVCGDDDVANTHNTGRSKAMEAASAIQAALVFPLAQGFTGKDFNDLHGQFGREQGTALIQGLVDQAMSLTVPTTARTANEADAQREPSAESVQREVSADSTPAHTAQTGLEDSSQAVFNTVERGQPAPEVSTRNEGVSRLEAVMARLKQQFLYADGKFYFRDKTNTLAFTDEETSFKTAHSRPEVVQAIVALAHAKGWKQLHINGSEEFSKRTWLEASLLGLQVTGYIPEPVDRALLQERLAVMAQDAAGVPVDTASPNTVAHADQTSPAVQGQTEPPPLAKMRQSESVIGGQIRTALQAQGVTDAAALSTTMASISDLLASPRAYVGVLLDHGTAPYKFNPAEKHLNYFAKLRTTHGEETIWGVDIQRTMTENRTAVGDTVLLVHQGSQPISVKVDIKDDAGQVVAQEERITQRNTWFAKSVQDLHEEAQDGVVVANAQRHEPPPAPPNHLPHASEAQASKGLEIVARAMAINQVSKDIASASIAAVAQRLREVQAGTAQFKNVRLVKAQDPKPRRSPTR